MKLSRGFRWFAFLLLTACSLGLVGLVASYFFHLDVPTWGGDRTSSNLGFFVLVNLSIIVVMVLGFLVGKNLIKLALDRKRNILGSRLRSRLVVAFVGLSLIPTVLLFLVAKGILESVLQGWFSPQIVSAVDGALEVAKIHYDSTERGVSRQVRVISRHFSSFAPYFEVGALDRESEEGKRFVETMKAYLEQHREEYGLFQLTLIGQNRIPLITVLSEEAENGVVDIPQPNMAVVREAMDGRMIVRPEQSIDAEFLRGYSPVFLPPQDEVFPAARSESSLQFNADEQAPGELSGLVVVATKWIPPALSARLATVVDAYDDYRELRTYRRPLASSYMLNLVVVTLMIVFAAIWVGFYLARSITVPIQLLAEGTQQVALSNLDYQIPEVGDDELSVLVRSFNIMTRDLKATNEEVDSSRRHMEAILANVGVGVISTDTKRQISTINIAAAEMLGIKDRNEVRHRIFSEVLPEEVTKEVSALLEEVSQSQEKVVMTNASLSVAGVPKHVHITLTKLVDRQGTILGAVILLDDITELVSAQRMAAWREVARRIAHEIKNPLTPIQLSAQRMQRRFRDNALSRMLRVSDKGVVDECTETIVKQVEILRTLVNEFSRFARLPKVNLQPVDLNVLLSETGTIYGEAHSDVDLEVELDQRLPVFDLDREQMNRVLINLLDNAISSLQGDGFSESGEADVSGEGKATLRLVERMQGKKAKVSLSSKYDESLQLVTIEVSDNGPGIPDEDKARVFEPYFSTKHGGTGLGLAIVSSIVSDHNGFIRVRDNEPQGARFIIELPVVAAAIRKLA